MNSASASAAIYLALEYVRGCDLLQLMRHCAQASLALPSGMSLSIINSVLGAHCLTDSTGSPTPLLHRDITPCTVLSSAVGEPQLIGFGIGGLRQRLAFTGPEVVNGRYPYLSPEQVKGQRADCRSDLFSVGAILFQLVTGHHPFA